MYIELYLGSSRQCCGTGFIESGSEYGSSISSESGSGSRILMIKTFLKKKIQRKICYIFYWSKIAIYFFPGLYKGHPSYRRSLQLSKENIQHFKKWNLLTFFFFMGLLCPPESGSTTLVIGTDRYHAHICTLPF
jgi:hypothetical protein